MQVRPRCCSGAAPASLRGVATLRALQLTCVWSTGRSEDDTIGDLKKLVAAQTGTRPEKIRIQKWYNVYKDHITLADYEIHDGMGARRHLKQCCASAC